MEIIYKRKKSIGEPIRTQRIEFPTANGIKRKERNYIATTNERQKQKGNLDSKYLIRARSVSEKRIPLSSPPFYISLFSFCSTISYARGPDHTLESMVTSVAPLVVLRCNRITLCCLCWGGPFGRDDSLAANGAHLLARSRGEGWG